MNIISQQRDGIYGNFLKNVLLIRIKRGALPKQTLVGYLDIVRAEMNQFDRFEGSIRLRFS